jgi:hypothetical protein
VLYVIVVVIWTTLLAPGAPEHPERDGDDQHGRSQLKVGLSRLPRVFLAEILTR